MGKIHGKDGVVQITDTAVAETTSWNLSTTSNQSEGSAQGDEFTTNLGGIKSQSGTIECNFDKDDATGQAVLQVNAVVPLKLFVEEDQSGATFYGGNALITDSEGGAPKDGLVSASFSYVNADKLGITKQSVA